MTDRQIKQNNKEYGFSDYVVVVMVAALLLVSGLVIYQLIEMARNQAA